MKKRVLVFPCGSEIGLEIFRSLSGSTHVELFGGSSVDDHGMFVYANYIGGLPYVNEPDFITKLNAILETHAIDFILPAHDSVVLKLAQEKAAGNLHAELITAPLKTCEVARSKRLTYQTLGMSLPTPKVYQLAEVTDADLPIFLKPDVGQGSKGVQLAKTREELSFYAEHNPELLLLEYLPGTEYTVDCFTDKRGQLLFSEGRERQRIYSGISVNSTVVQDERFSKLARSINEQLDFRGVWFFQVKENAGKELVLMEIAPRVAGTMALTRCRGVNLPLLSVFDAMDYDVSILENDYQLTIDRALENNYRHNLSYKHVYLDFDDLVIFEGKVNPAVMAFVYQCLNKHVQVHLLTRHRDVLEASLATYKLGGVFDDLQLVTEGQEKHHFITEREAIFIDDSFAERQKVHEALKLPVFDSTMIESLMEPF